MLAGILILVTLSVTPQGSATAQPQPVGQDNWDSLAAVFNKELSSFTSPILEERKRTRVMLQRRGYSDVLMNILSEDALSAVFSYVRTLLQIEYSISHRPVYLRIPISGGGTVNIPLPDDWSFPADPWRKD